MKLQRIHLLLVALGIICTPALSAVEPSPDEVSVYHALFATERLVVLRSWGEREDLSPESVKIYEPYHDSFVAANRKLFPSADASTIESFFTRRKLIALLTPKTDIGIRCVVLDGTIYKMLYPSGLLLSQNLRKSPDDFRGRGWRAFQQRYPKATAVTYVTRVGFNTDATQALVFLQQSTGPRIGDEPRHTILLDRRNDAWTITQKEKD